MISMNIPSNIDIAARYLLFSHIKVATYIKGTVSRDGSSSKSYISESKASLIEQFCTTKQITVLDT
jgi:hypothetical protein